MRMRLLVAAVLLSLGFAPAPFPKPRAQQASDLSRMQGTWDVVERTLGGRSVLTEQPTQIKINGSRFDFVVRGEIRSTWEMKLDPTATPRTIDRVGGAGGDTVLKGVYRFESDRLIIAYSQNRRLVKGQDDAYEYLMTLKRAGR